MASFVEAGWTSVVSVPNGAVMKVVDNDINPEDDNKFRFLWDAKDELDQAGKIIIATNNNEYSCHSIDGKGKCKTATCYCEKDCSYKTSWSW